VLAVVRPCCVPPRPQREDLLSYRIPPRLQRENLLLYRVPPRPLREDLPFVPRPPREDLLLYRVPPRPPREDLLSYVHRVLSVKKKELRASLNLFQCFC